MPDKTTAELISAARKRLIAEWTKTSGKEITKNKKVVLPPDVAEAICRSMNSETLTYRYVLPTQVLAKVVDSSLDCRSVQASSGLLRAFDARSLCHQVVVDFDRTNNSVLGGSKEPYLNNPLRIPSITTQHRNAQKNKSGFDDLRVVLDYVESKPGSARQVLTAILRAIHERLASVSVVYPVPNRVSLKQSKEIVDAFLEERTGGLRLQAIGVALFRTIGDRFGLFSNVYSSNINAADASTGKAADLECVDDAKGVAIAVEVKDRQLTLRSTQDKLPGLRNKGIRELLFLVQAGVAPDDAKAVDDLVDKEFVTGQNIYVCDFSTFLNSCLTLFGERGRRSFLICIGEQLESQKADIIHRRKWASLLETI